MTDTKEKKIVRHPAKAAASSAGPKETTAEKKKKPGPGSSEKKAPAKKAALKKKEPAAEDQAMVKAAKAKSEFIPPAVKRHTAILHAKKPSAMTEPRKAAAPPANGTAQRPAAPPANGTAQRPAAPQAPVVPHGPKAAPSPGGAHAAATAAAAPAPAKPAAPPPVTHAPAKPAAPPPVPRAPVKPPLHPKTETPPKPAAAPAATPAPAAPAQPAAPKAAAARLPAPAPAPAAPRLKISVNEMTTVKELAEKMNVKLPEVIKKLMSLGIMANMNQRVNMDAAGVVADAFGFDVEAKQLYAQESLEIKDDPSKLKPRPPVVTVMGHVDHGKTSLLDAIRKTRVAEKEAGGITQHIGAYQVQTDKGPITFLDTPGHQAFTAMRARGAQATDLVILVVAADDGVMPQTVEALDHAKAANVPILVAINKCDLPAANPQKIKQELTQHGLVPEDWGGKNVMVEVSARQHTNIDKLLEMVALEAEMLELKADPDRAAQGVVVEARLDPRRGPVATVLVQKGTLRVGDPFVCGITGGKVRALTNDRGERVKEATPAYPVEILGLASTPQAGDKFVAVADEREARVIAERRRVISVGEAQVHRQHLTLEALHDEAAAGKVKALPIVLKADVQGSLEALRDSLEKLSTSEISLRIIHGGVGGITTSDVILADASDAIILGFNVRPDPASEEMARRDGVEIKSYRIIYDMVNDVKAALEGLLDPEEIEVTLGWAEVRQVFRVPKAGTVAGSFVTDGKLSRAGKARLIRNGTIVFDGGLASLKRFKEDVRDVEKGFECGLALANFQDIKVGDRVEVYVIEKKARKL